MTATADKRRLVIPVVLIGCGLAICAWQVEEHFRFRRAARETLINRGSDITSTLGVLLRSQRRFGVVSKEQLQSALQDLIRAGELESVTVLASTGETIASAGTRADLTPEALQAAGGVHWSGKTLTILKDMDLGVNADDGSRWRAPIVISDDRNQRSRPGPSRRGPEPIPPSVPVPATEKAAAVAVAGGEKSEKAGPATGAVSEKAAPVGVAATTAPTSAFRRASRVHSFVLSLSTLEMRRTIRADLLLRSWISLLALGGAVVSLFAWRNTARNADLQIRLVKAGEMNTHLKEMNLAAAGLAHETRNPLNLIRGLAQMIAMQAKEQPKLHDHASTIIEETDRVTVQLNEFINYSKPREAQVAAVAVARLVTDVARTLLPDLEEKKIELRAPESTLAVMADEQLLRQALFNVLLNATQAVAPGGRIDVRLVATSPREAILEIMDDGPGVAPTDRASIFKPYFTKRPGGVGLGLAIVAQIAAVHHWEVTCLANEPRGAVFRFAHLAIAPSPA